MEMAAWRRQSIVVVCPIAKVTRSTAKAAHATPANCQIVMQARKIKGGNKNSTTTAAIGNALLYRLMESFQQKIYRFLIDPKWGLPSSIARGRHAARAVI
jgi:hypothetical protein